MPRAYHTLLSLQKNATAYAIEFGDYDRDCVKEERDDMIAAHDYSGAKFRIIKTGDRQADIDAVVATFNARL